MPRVREELVRGYSWCPDGMCDGNAQQPADVIRQEVEQTMLESGGDSNQVEKGFTYYRLADEEPLACGVCGRMLECDEQERPVYPASNWDPDGLRKLINAGVKAARGTPDANPELDALKQQLAALEAKLAENTEAKRGPGRPRKNPDEETA